MTTTSPIAPDDLDPDGLADALDDGLDPNDRALLYFDLADTLQLAEDAADATTTRMRWVRSDTPDGLPGTEVPVGPALALVRDEGVFLMSTNAETALDQIYAHGFHGDDPNWRDTWHDTGLTGDDFCEYIDLAENGLLDQIRAALAEGKTWFVVTLTHKHIHWGFARPETLEAPTEADARALARRLAQHKTAPKVLPFFGGPFSNWAPTPLTMGEITFPTAEHAMMHAKATLFGDEKIARKIITAPNPFAAKALGRAVKGFTEGRWQQARYDIVRNVLRAKFSQNAQTAEHLLLTEDAVLVEASPFDRIWGIGRSVHDPAARIPAQWRGLNLLGFALMDVRAQLADKPPADAATS